MSTKVKRFSLGAVALTASVVIGVVCLGGATATASPKSHTIHFIAVTSSQSTPTTSGSFFGSLVDVGASQTTVSDGVLSCGPIAEAQCDAALADANGILDSHFTIGPTGALSGTVTGGTGAYANATGTLSGQPVRGGEAVTIVYTT
jgi:hypothetical protein